MARRGKPVVDRRSNPTAFDWRVAGTVMTGDEQNESLASPDRSFQVSIDRPPGHIEIHPMQVDHPIGLEIARAEPSIPASIKRPSELRSGLIHDWRCSRSRNLRASNRIFMFNLRRLLLFLLT